MLKLIKYEFLGRFKLIFGGFAALILINIILIVGFNFWWQGGMEAALAISSVLGFLGAFIVAIDSIILVRRDLYNDTGYLVFTIPKSGYAILGAKLIVGILEIVMYIALQILISAIFIIPLISSEFWTIFNEIMQYIPNLLMIIIVIFWSLISLLLIITFSIVLAKSILNTRKFGNLASFGAFIVVSIVIGFIQNLLQKIPWNVNLSFLNFNYGSINMHAGTANVPELIYMVVLPILLFISAGYLIENKLEMR